MDVSMNAQGVALDQRTERPIFASFHAAFSFGAMAGAAAGSVAAGAGLEPAVHLTLAGLPSRWSSSSRGAACCRRRRMRARTDRSSRALRARSGTRRPRVLRAARRGLGQRLECDPARPRDRCGAVAGGARAGRLLADHGRRAARCRPARRALRPGRGRARRRAARRRGLALALTSSSAVIGIAGFAVMGAGLAGLFPLALSAAGETDGPAAPALAAVATSGYGAFIAGPALIGLLSERDEPAARAVTRRASSALPRGPRARAR